MRDLNDLYYFVQVVDHNGFAPAGRQLGIPKSKLSRRIALLEEALGVRLTPERAPVLTALLDRAGDDRSVVGAAKDYWGTKRPYIGGEQPICEAKSDHLAGNPDYPSGHSAHGMHTAMILAELVPMLSRLKEDELLVILYFVRSLIR